MTDVIPCAHPDCDEPAEPWPPAGLCPEHVIVHRDTEPVAS